MSEGTGWVNGKTPEPKYRSIILGNLEPPPPPMSHTILCKVVQDFLIHTPRVVPGVALS